MSGVRRKTFDVWVDPDGNVLVGVIVSRANVYVTADSPVFALTDREAFTLANDIADALKRSRDARGVSRLVVDLTKKKGRPS